MVRASLSPFGEDVDRQTDEDGIQAVVGYGCADVLYMKITKNS